MLNIPGFALMDDQMFSGLPSNSNKPSKKAKRDRSKTTKSKVSDKPESFARNAPSSMASRSGQNPIGGASSMTPDERIMAALTQDQEVTMKANQKLSTSRRAKQSCVADTAAKEATRVQMMRCCSGYCSERHAQSSH